MQLRMLLVLRVFREEKQHAEAWNCLRNWGGVVRGNGSVRVWTSSGAGGSQTSDYDNARGAELWGVGGTRQGADREGPCRDWQRRHHASELQRALHDGDGAAGGGGGGAG